MKAYSLSLKLLLRRFHPLPYDYALVLPYAHSSTEWNICLIIKQTINKSALFTKKKLSTGSLHYKELCKEQGWPGGFLSPPLESYSKWKEASSPWAQQEPTHRQSCRSQGSQRAALTACHCICAILPVTAVSADP